MKKILSLGTLALAGVLAFTGCGKDKGMTQEEALKYAEEQGYVKVTAPAALPTARLDDCNSNDFGATCSSINEENLNQYLGRSDVRYVDLRSFDEYAEMHVEGFENVDFFTDIYGDTDQLFYRNGDKGYMPRYEGSVAALEKIFPKGQTFFFMCKSGSRVSWLMKILELNGWDMSKIYNVGGMTTMNAMDWADEHLVTIAGYKTEKTWKTGVISEGVSPDIYKTIVNIQLDNNNKITQIYVTGNPYTTIGNDDWNPETWITQANAYAASLVGKTLDDIEDMLGEDGATGTDVVTGATTTSNRVLEAVVKALTPAAEPAPAE